MSDPDTKPADTVTYVDRPDAPIVYFDIAPAHGVMAGAIEIELAARTLNPLSDGSVEVRFVTTARLRCSQAGGLHLRNALEAALKMLEVPEQVATAGVEAELSGGDCQRATQCVLIPHDANLRAGSVRSQSAARAAAPRRRARRRNVFARSRRG